MSDSTQELLERLRAAGTTLPFELRQRILEAASNELVSGLVALVRNDALRADDRETYAPPVHAAMLLGLIGAESATDVLIERVRSEGDDSALGTVSGRALQNMGPEAGLPAVLEAHEESASPRERRRLARVAGGFEGRDARVVELLGRELRTQPTDAQHEILLAMDRYGEKSAVAEIRRWFADASLDPEEADERFLIEVSAKIVRGLGGQLGDDHRDQLERARGVEAPD